MQTQGNVIRTNVSRAEQSAGLLMVPSQSALAEAIAGRDLRRGAGGLAQVLVLAATMCGAVALTFCVDDLLAWATHRIVLWVTLACIGCWRWGWFAIQNGRAVLYRYFVYPEIRRRAQEAVIRSGPVPEVVVMATTYHEKPWITRIVFRSIFDELATIAGLTRRPRVVVATGSDEDDANIRAVFEEYRDPSLGTSAGCWPPELVLLREGNGKRAAITAALHEIARGKPLEDGVVVFVDGDTLLQPGFFKGVLPLFRLEPRVAGATTNEDGYVKGPSWFAEWISLRFGLRHRTMCSMALSGKLLCLTGRLSVFRASVAIDPSFISQIECDTIHHWLWGSFDMLSGDDKSTWFWLSRHGLKMLYVPDSKVTTIEVVQESVFKRAYANIRRWSGNSLRHNWRAVRLGPGKLSWFPWWSLIDQRLAMFTVLFGPLLFLTALVNGRLVIAAGFALWLILSRLAHSAIAWRHGRRWSALYVPLILLSDWATAVTKIWILFHPAKQSWLNRGARTLDGARQSSHYGLRAGLATYLYGFTCLTVICVVATATGFFPILLEARLFLSGSDQPAAAAQVAPVYDKAADFAPGRSTVRNAVPIEKRFQNSTL